MIKETGSERGRLGKEDVLEGLRRQKTRDVLGKEDTIKGLGRQRVKRGTKGRVNERDEGDKK